MGSRKSRGSKKTTGTLGDALADVFSKLEGRVDDSDSKEPQDLSISFRARTDHVLGGPIDGACEVEKGEDGRISVRAKVQEPSDDDFERLFEDYSDPGDSLYTRSGEPGGVYTMGKTGVISATELRSKMDFISHDSRITLSRDPVEAEQEVEGVIRDRRYSRSPHNRFLVFVTGRNNKTQDPSKSVKYCVTKVLERLCSSHNGIVTFVEGYGGGSIIVQVF